MSYNGGFDLAREQSYPTPFSNSSLFLPLLLSLATVKHTPSTKKFFNPEYDFVVVGAGSAGCVIAARLTEDPSKTVLLLEAGPSPPLLTEVPAAEAFFPGSDIYWNYSTVPQKFAALAHENRTVSSPTGRTVGGSSAVNGMLYVRGNHEDYNNWEKMGACCWNWCDVFPYFRKAEDNTDPEIAYNGFHSVGGPMTVGGYNSIPEFEQPLKNAALSLGYPFRDINGAHQYGFAAIQGNVRRGQRMSTAKAYLVPNENRPNLDIVEGAYVTKVLIANRTAQGVQFDFDGSVYKVKAKCEVILCAGTLKTPQILMLSGIGPTKTLKRFRIPVIANLPVGKNFQDHGSAVINFYSTKPRATILEKFNDSNIWRYIRHRNGPLAGVVGLFGWAFLAGNATAQKCDLPEYELYIGEAVRVNEQKLDLSPQVFDKLYGPYLNKAVIGCVSQDLVPESRGYVSIRSRNPYDHPVVDPKYYKIRQDVRHVVEGLKTCYRVMESPFMKELGFRPFDTLMPGCEGLSDKEEYLECYARSHVLGLSHQVGTARMGHINDPKTVVDTKLRVKGIKGLRVADASVMPKVPRGNTNSPVIMIAEKVSDIIKGCY